jgi:hypothetical protein
MHDSYNTHRMLGYGVENVEHPRLLEKHDEPDGCECKRNVPWRQRSTAWHMQAGVGGAWGCVFVCCAIAIAMGQPTLKLEKPCECGQATIAGVSSQ